MLFGDVNDDINTWLAANPVVLGAGAILIGLILAGLGVTALVTGKAPQKKGKDLEGGQAKAMGFVWLFFGVLAIGFGLFKALVR